MKVTLLNYTTDALDLLLRTKNTRLDNKEDDPAQWSEARKAEHLAYMRHTIKSSWEFVDYVFLIEGVTRAFTHQLVRTRHGSYAQEAMRVIDASDHAVTTPPKIAAAADQEMNDYWEATCEDIMIAYEYMIGNGVALQDARGILPTNIQTSITAKFNLRTLANMGELRLCTRTQGEYQDAFRLMRAEVIAVHPWAEEFINVYCANYGICAFPDYGRKECPFFQHTINDEAMRAAKYVHKVFWEGGIRHEAAPTAKGGKAM